MPELPDPLFVAALAAAWRDGTLVPRQPALEPVQVDTAFAVQAGVVAGLDEQVPGWKVGFAPDGQAVAAPLLARTFRANGARIARPRNQPLRIEIEMAFRLARDLPPRHVAYTRAEVLAAIGEVVVGLETLAFRVDPATPLPFAVLAADNLANEGYVAGEGTGSFAALDLASLRCRLDVDGAPFHDRVGGHPQGDPVEPLRAWASTGRHPLGPLRAGQLVTTGSLSPPLALDRSAVLRGSIEGIGAVSLDLE